MSERSTAETGSRALHHGMRVEPEAADDAALLTSWTAREDRAAAQALFARHADAAYRVALRACGNPADAEDAVQTAFIEVLRQAGKYRGESAVKGWIFGFVVNACRHKAREEGRRAVREEKASVPEGAAPASPDLRDAVRDAVRRLPEHYRLPLWLHYCEGLSSPEVADALSLSENTVRSQISRGIEELRSAMSGASLAAVTSALAGAAAAESAPPTLTAALSGLASSAPAAASTSAAGKFVAFAAAAAALVGTTAALLWGEPAPEPKPKDFAWIDARVLEWQPAAEERRIDEIRWAPSLAAAIRATQDKPRPVLVLAHVGTVSGGRSDGGSMAFRGGALADPRVIELLNTRFIPAMVRSSGDDLDHERVYGEAMKKKLGAGSERLYVLEAGTGAVLESAHICHVTVDGCLAILKRHAGPAGEPVFPAGAVASSETMPSDALPLEVTARYLTESGEVKRGSKYTYHAFPAEERITLSGAEQAALVPPPGSAAGASWEVGEDVARKLLGRFYPLTGNFTGKTNRVLEAPLRARWVSGGKSTVWVALEGSVRLSHSYFPDKDERIVRSVVAGYVEIDAATRRIRTLKMITDRGTYGPEPFAVALRSR